MKVVPRSAADSVEAAPPPQNASLHAIASSNADAESPLFRTPSPHTSCDTCQHSNTDSSGVSTAKNLGYSSQNERYVQKSVEKSNLTP